MKDKLKSKLVFLLIITALVIVLLQAYLNRNSTVNYSLKKAEAIADIVQSGLTAHMINNTMDNRKAFLQSIANTDSVDNIWVVRGENVVKQYGNSKFPDDIPHDEIDFNVLKTGQMQYTIMEDFSNAKLRVTIPYKADINTQINCLDCHNVQKGDTLGGVSIVLDISDFKSDGVLKLLTVVITILFAILLVMLIINRMISPYLKTLDVLQKKLKYASKGEFRFVDNSLKDGGEELGELITSYNTLTASLMETFSEIEQKLKGFVGKTNSNSSTNPLIEATDVLSNLSLLYQFKKQIQLDKDKYEIYNRLGSVFKNYFYLDHVNILEFNNDKVELVYGHGKHDFCSSSVINDCEQCRAYRNGSNIISVDHHQNCPTFTNQEYKYYCIEKKLDKSHSLVFNFILETEEDYDVFVDNVSIIENYIFEAKPEIEMRLLLQALEDTSLKDGLTGMYNRRYYDTYIKNMVSLAKRQGTKLGLVMVDIDHFKAVNDEYGHDIGDKVLVETANIIQSNVRETDIPVRFGGEEFVVILVDVESAEAVHIIAEKLRNKIAENEIEVYAGSTIKKTASFGFAIFPDDSSNLTTVLKNADIALYEAKNTGRNQVIQYKEEDKNEIELF
jgi:diguanylate cyclase (GGDEF)-like protein